MLTNKKRKSIEALQRKMEAAERSKKRMTRKRRRASGTGHTRRAVAGTILIGGSIAAAVETYSSGGQAAERHSREDSPERDPNVVASEQFLQAVDDYTEVCETESVRFIAFVGDDGYYLAPPSYYQGEGEPPKEWIEERRRAAAEQARIEYIPEESPPLENTSLIDITEYYGDKKRAELGNKSPIEYVKEHAGEGLSGVSPLVRNELMRLIPGIAAQESQYNNNARSTYALGVFQFRPTTWDRYRMHHPGTETEKLGEDPEHRPYASLPDQTEGAGWYLGVIERYLTNECEDELKDIKHDLFGNDQRKFERYFLVPCIVNAYNAGEGRMKKVIQWFHREYRKQRSERDFTAPRNAGYDAFFTMAQQARASNDPLTSDYGRFASQYFSSVYAFSNILQRPLRRVEEEEPSQS